MNTLDFNEKLQEARKSVELRKYPHALGLYATLVEHFPESGIWEEYGSAAAASGDFDLAERVWETILSRQPNTAGLLSRLAYEYGKIWLFSKARALCFRAANLEPGNLEMQLSLASFLARTNSVDEARTAVNKCLEIDPRGQQARYLSAHLRLRENKLDDAERQFRDLLASPALDPQVVHLCRIDMALLFDRTGRYDEAFSQIAEARSIATRNMNIDAAQKRYDEQRANILRTTKSLARNSLETWGKSFPPEERLAAAPLAFLGGHARSGTTLLEKILDAHPAVAAYDESLAFHSSILPLVNIMAPVIPAKSLNFLRKRYLNNLTKESGPPGEGKVLVDKNPAPTIFLPAFLRVFPEMRALIALRDPRDVLVSCYFQDLPNFSHTSFERLAQHYCCVMDVWLMIREWEGLSWMETRYEDIVADLQKEGARVTKFIGLEWHENQAQFFERNREKPVMSTNYKDVTQPVYTRSIGRWRAYEKYLAPVLPVLEPYCKKFGYE